MTVADWQRVGTLLWKYGHKLLEGSCRLSQLEFYLNAITVDQILSERSIVERIEPVPALDPFIIIRVNPSETLAVRLPDPHSKVSLFRVSLG